MKNRDNDAGRRPSDEAMNQAVVEIMQVLSHHGMTLTEGIGVLEAVKYELFVRMDNEETEP